MALPGPAAEIVLLGDVGIGKTSLLSQFVKCSFIILPYLRDLAKAFEDFTFLFEEVSARTENHM
jgi:GTPase SAR1 family protein